jgi:hypothetical protein
MRQRLELPGEDRPSGHLDQAFRPMVGQRREAAPLPRAEQHCVRHETSMPTTTGSAVR